jgi:ankyrin repeat protein
MLLSLLLHILFFSSFTFADDATDQLLVAAEIGSVEMLHKLLQDHPTIDLEMKWKVDIPLHTASVNGKVEFVQELLERGVNPDIKDFYGFRAITMAATAGEPEVVSMLIRYGSKIFEEDEVDELKYYLLEAAAQNGQVEVAKVLLSHGMDINHLSDEKNTPLIMASLHGMDETVDFLLKAGADPKIRNDQGNTGLHAAAYKGFHKVARLLIQAGLDPNEPNADGTLPMILAARGNYPKVLRELLRGGADVNAVDGNNVTPISIAAKSSHMEMVNILLPAHPDLEITDSTHHTALHHTYINNHREASKILALAGASHGPLDGFHDGLDPAQIPKVPVCYWFRGLLKRFKFSQKQTRGQAIGRKACEYLYEVHGYHGSIVKLLDKISFFGYRATVDNLGFETFLPNFSTAEATAEAAAEAAAEAEAALEELKKAARADLKSMHTKDYKEHFRQTDEDEMEKNLPSILRKFGADIPKERGEDDLSLADIANERVSRKEFHRAPKEQRPDHFKEAKTVSSGSGKRSRRHDDHDEF